MGVPENASFSPTSSGINEVGRNELLPLSETTFDQSMRSRNSEVLGNASNEIVSEWVDDYEPGVEILNRIMPIKRFPTPGVYVILGKLKDGTRDVLLLGFSWRRFKVHQAEAWWRTRIQQSSRFKENDNFIMVEWIEECKTRDATWGHLSRNIFKPQEAVA
ncbi:hypothetical protein CDL12_06750 [Handroanthus impetiginosus]|uniref:BRX domain-containing protein n=1 Tax=Handroanthus impetiginosus TaxID=429701 RepID=A0A2G9HSR8_9LAMI|nr:hypothetical protein CDL12_06750 [Handroanthus impetiginosus]